MTKVLINLSAKKPDQQNAVSNLLHQPEVSVSRMWWTGVVVVGENDFEILEFIKRKENSVMSTIQIIHIYFL